MAVILVYTVLFHVIMLYEVGEQHSWITRLYWTLTVMSILGFEDVTFQSDAGRLFTVVVLLSGIVMLLIVLQFAFIRFFCAPWLESQIRNTAPRTLPDDTRDHVSLPTTTTLRGRRPTPGAGRDSACRPGAGPAHRRRPGDGRRAGGGRDGRAVQGAQPRG